MHFSGHRMGIRIRFLRWLGRSVYPAVVPVPGVGTSAGAERYLEDLWREAPARVALASTALAAAACVLPPLLLRRMALFPSLPREAREEMLARMLASRCYFLRAAAQALRGSALVAVLRDTAARAEILGKGPAG